MVPGRAAPDPSLPMPHCAPHRDPGHRAREPVGRAIHSVQETSRVFLMSPYFCN